MKGQFALTSNRSYLDTLNTIPTVGSLLQQGEAFASMD